MTKTKGSLSTGWQAIPSAEVAGAGHVFKPNRCWEGTLFPSFQDWEVVVRQDWVWPSAGPSYAVLATWLCGGASCKQEESCLPPALLSNSTNTKAAGQAVGAGQQLPPAGAFLLVLLGFPVYMEGKRFIQSVSFTSTITPADQ